MPVGARIDWLMFALAFDWMLTRFALLAVVKFHMPKVCVLPLPSVAVTLMKYCMSAVRFGMTTVRKSACELFV